MLMKGEKRHINWEQQWLEGQISSAEARNIAPDADQIEHIERLVEGSKNLDIPRVLSNSQAWEALESKISFSSPKVVSISRRNWIIGIAASFILTLGAFFLFNTNSRTITTALAETQEVNLPDGSKAFLNAASSLSFNTDWSEQRTLKLDGEAFFEVKKGKAFSVITPFGKVEVLGTSFNVRTRNEQLTVVCKTGKVQVSNSNGTQKTVINPGQMVKVNDGTIDDPITVNATRADVWRSNEFDYESMPLREIFEEMERIFDVTIEHDLSEDELNASSSGTFSTKAIRDAILTIELTMGYDAKLEQGGKVVRFSDK